MKSQISYIRNTNYDCTKRYDTIYNKQEIQKWLNIQSQSEISLKWIVESVQWFVMRYASPILTYRTLNKFLEISFLS